MSVKFQRKRVWFVFFNGETVSLGDSLEKAKAVRDQLYPGYSLFNVEVVSDFRELRERAVSANCTPYFLER